MLPTFIVVVDEVFSFRDTYGVDKHAIAVVEYHCIKRKRMEKGLSIFLIILVHSTVAQKSDEIPVQRTAAEMLYDSMQASDFIKIFSKFEKSRIQLDIREQDIFEEYRTAFLDDDATNALCRKWLKNDLAIDKLKKKYYKKLKRAASPSLASRYVLYEKVYVRDR